ncbi:tRNA dihydrouridine synthase DusB [Fusibacter ferrireducens]|uniref:tRNA-dihydrouridine synthase n=1 Tax=Fusibacter ferrireducens TaxID=2785058 RepID=A0ABR9ZYR3_9FIRM|nr:tRNA dihydrouridine synthase DusB [Fusibacter ferrireducens]MBF4695594.1 tRNA dihydrouridine synthase DusB [Fusibacter ferrireducens]
MKIGSFQTENDVILAPMAGVTDLAFRLICKDFGVGLMVTEMVSISALYYKDKKTHKVMEILEAERPMSLQIFTKDCEKLEAVMGELNQHNNDILDINMGCPAPKIVNNGEGSALMKTPKLAEQILKTAVKHSSKPVTVKFRKGWDEQNVNAVEFAKMAEASGVSAIAIHGRTRAQMYNGEADWEIIKAVKSAVKIPVIGNGDVFSVDDAMRMKSITHCDGIMIGRGVQGNPWLLKEVASFLKSGESIEKPTMEEKSNIALKHFELLLKYKGSKIGTLEMRKHAAWYFKGLKHANAFKNEINRADDPEMVKTIIIRAFQAN